MLGTIFAIIAALVGSFIIGFIWYGPLFGKKWSQYTGIKQDDKEMKENISHYMIKTQIVDIIGVIALAYIIHMGQPANMGQLVVLIILLWLAFSVPAVMAPNIWEKKPLGLGLINIFCSLASALVAGIILMKMM